MPGHALLGAALAFSIAVSWRRRSVSPPAACSAAVSAPGLQPRLPEALLRRGLGVLALALGVRYAVLGLI